ncbi:hypothetical protein, partial [Salmonella enterica]|uniref:hypothetical protein n=1 Tax=Salmonella enterica TaxID=28901 RepID=UPI003EDB9214
NVQWQGLELAAFATSNADHPLNAPPATRSDWWRFRYFATDSASGPCFRSDMSLSHAGTSFGPQPHITPF